MELPFDDLPPPAPQASRDRDRHLLHQMRSMRWPEHAPKDSLHVYTDGACSGNPGPGGWGVLLRSANGQEKELFGGEANTTNNRM